MAMNDAQSWLDRIWRDAGSHTTFANFVLKVLDSCFTALFSDFDLPAAEICHCCRRGIPESVVQAAIYTRNCLGYCCTPCQNIRLAISRSSVPR